MSIAHLLKRLREERGLTQAELAARAGVSTSTVSVAEFENSEHKRTWSKSTARRVFLALDSYFPIPMEDGEVFLKHFGFDPALASSMVRTLTPAWHWSPPTPPSAQAPPRQASARAFHEAPPGPSDAAGQVHQIADNLIAAVGPRRAADLLTAIAATVTALAPQPEPDRELAVISPPRPSSIPGAVEHAEVTYTKSPAAIKRAVKATQSPKPPPPHPKSA